MPDSDTIAGPAKDLPPSSQATASADTSCSADGTVTSTGLSRRRRLPQEIDPTATLRADLQAALLRTVFSNLAPEHIHISPLNGMVRITLGDQTIDKPMTPELALYYASTFLSAAREMMR